MAGEGDPVVVDAAQVSQAEDLEAAGIGEDGSLPGHEPMEPAQPGDALRAGAQAEVIGVAQDHLDPGSLQVTGGQGLHRALGTDRHELGRIDDAVRRLEAPEAGTAGRGAAGREVDR